MGDNVHVESIEALQRLSEAYKCLTERTVQLLAVVDREFNCRWEYLERQYQRQESRVQALREALSRTDSEDEQEEIYARLREAEIRLDEMRTCMARLRSQYEAYKRQAWTLKDFAEKKTPHAVSFLRDCGEELKSFLAVSLPGEAGEVIEGSTPERSLSVDAAPSSKQPPDVGRYVLPDGFQWIPLRDIELNDLPSDEEFQKASKDEMRHGFEQLPKVLELLQGRLHESTMDLSLYFMRLDRRAGCSYQEGLQKVFESFFASAPIVLERSSEQPNWTILNGRHRIWVAQQLGWTAVPARLRVIGGEGR